ncbi:hypothetical protein [Leptospira sarikeiensis]|uniref:DUF1566 domain-containing protein n=1 Tax=Leptospira sarikeiensis TaxID=2484943 RepID=A0A4R9K2A4_9LEPT|nr:hypothetical protein [Leptospira sarikeiensis]TGL58326.1 hypothetical protein EHQ64_18730 [Leptospira sarikeiensis]
MKHIGAILLLSVVTLTNCGSDSKQDLSGLILLLGGSGILGVYCGQTASNPVSFGTATNGATVADESGLIAALGGNNCQTPSLTNNGNGTVTDTANRFMWTLCVIDGTTSPKQPHTYSNPNCGGFTGSDSSFDQGQGESICSGMTFAGRSNWEMPDAIQSNTLKTASAPYALGVFGTADNSFADAQLIWSSSEVTGSLAIFSRYANGAAFYSGDKSTTSQGAFVCLSKL